MKPVESIFKTETTVSGLVEIFRMIIGDEADILNSPSCDNYSLIGTE
jgi:hypothetical protein